ncbi:MAG: hypothetical protein EOP04_09195 [Proteobacteria bacterium]|nr:MAG: hypothetical protein EOP04_09195 [Pseudomonadota bacterium]
MEKFRLWADEREDDVLLIHVKRFFEQETIPRLSREERDKASRRDKFESEVKHAARDRLAQWKITASAVIAHGGC